MTEVVELISVRAVKAKTGDHLVVGGDKRLIVDTRRAGCEVHLVHPRSVSLLPADAVIRVRRLSWGRGLRRATPDLDLRS
jgi:hypothetical protein